MSLDERAVVRGLEQLERARTWSARLVSRLEAAIRQGPEQELFRLNPLAFAAERGLDEAEVTALFLHAAHAGLFNMDWQLVCPSCNDAVESTRSLAAVGTSYHCNLCSIDIRTSVDDLIQVTFTVSPSIRRLRLHDPDSLPIEDFCFRYHFSTGLRGLDGTPWIDAIRPFVVLMSYVEPGKTELLKAVLKPGFVKGADRANRLELEFDVEGEPVEDQRLELVLRDGQLVQPASAQPGPTTFAVRNEMPRRAALLAINPGEGRLPPKRYVPPFLTARRLFVNQTFRDLFRGETVKAGLELKDLTFVFTDLKGSTELYERVGDLHAFQLVEDHFARLSSVVARHGGAVVKTIGDAIMATFERPVDAVASARAMRQAIADLNHRRGAAEIILKIGIHRGAAIAVTMNDRLDYFGQTVNIAARVQGVADADEICMTDEVRGDADVARALRDEPTTRAEMAIKGLQRKLWINTVPASR